MAENFTNLSNVVVQGYVTSSGQGTLLGSFETMPAASAQNTGQIVLYTGATSSTYTKGLYYKSNGTTWLPYDAGQITSSTLEGYVPKDGNKVLSTNDYTTAEKTKLAGIATGAQVNVIETVQVDGTTVTPSGKTVNIDIASKLAGYATKADVSAIPKFKVEVVSSLPTSGISESTIYLLGNGGSNPNAYDEYLYKNNKWEKIGSTETDLSNYVTNDALNSALSGYQPTITAGTGISKSGNTIGLATSGVSAGSQGSATSIPTLTVDSFGRVTALGSTTVYPPTTAGTSGQVWTSDGSGAGAWVTPATSASSGNSTPITSGAVYSELQGKQDKLAAAGSSTTPVYINSNGVPTACSYSLGTAASKGATTAVTSGSADLVTSGAVYSAINTKQNLITVSSSEPTSSDGSNGDLWAVYE